MIQIHVDKTQRFANMRPHTATHLLHYFLDQTIGGTKQAGSRVGNDELRFDFAATTALTHQELESIEQQINAAIMGDYPVSVESMSYADAIAYGAKAFFDDKYGDEVRVVSCVGTALTSIELCGGTHVASTGQIGACKIVAQESVASGIRRIIAYTGSKVTEYARARDTELLGISMILDCQVKQIPEKLEKMLKEYTTLKNAYHQLETHMIQQVFSNASQVVHQDIPVVIGFDQELNRKSVVEYAKHHYANTTWCVYHSNGSFALGSHDNTAKIIATKLGLTGGGHEQLVQGKDTSISSKLFC